MDIGSILIILAVALVAAAYIARPLMEGGGRQLSSEDLRLSALQAERDKVLDSLQEMDNDFAMGKIPEQDYQHLRRALVAQGAEVLKQLEAWEPRPGPAVRAGAARPPGDELDAAIEVRISQARRRGRRAGSFCSQCGTPLMAGDRYCTHCGAAVGASTVRA
jgi:hypothetical protein